MENTNGRLLEIEEALNGIIDKLHIAAAESHQKEESAAAVQYEELPIADSYGRVLAEDIISPINVPEFNRSAMDGYAVCSADTTDEKVVLKVAGEILAGEYKEIPFESGTAVRVMTGAFIPEGFDAVVKQEDTDCGSEEVEIYTSVKPYMNYCKKGEDIKSGETVLTKGTRIAAIHVGILASLGYAYVKVKKALKVAIISTGSELMSPGEPLRPGKIYNNTAFLLEAAIKRAGLKVVLRTSVSDDEHSLWDTIYNAVRAADIVITTGGVSVGKKDLLPEVLSELGCDIIFRRVNIQPGTPTIGSVLEGTPILSLSGNPYAAIANFEVYFWDVAAELMGCKELGSQVENAVMGCEYTKKNKLRRLVRAYAAEGKVYLPESVHASSVIANMTECNCFIDVPAGTSLAEGDRVKIRRIKY